VLSKCWLE